MNQILKNLRIEQKSNKEIEESRKCSDDRYEDPSVSRGSPAIGHGFHRFQSCKFSVHILIPII